MGVLDFPRIHFRGVPSGGCEANVPTGNNDNDGSIDTSTLQLYMNKKQVDPNVTPSEWWEYMRTVINLVFVMIKGRTSSSLQRIRWTC